MAYNITTIFFFAWTKYTSATYMKIVFWILVATGQPLRHDCWLHVPGFFSDKMLVSKSCWNTNILLKVCSKQLSSWYVNSLISNHIHENNIYFRGDEYIWLLLLHSITPSTAVTNKRYLISPSMWPMGCLMWIFCGKYIDHVLTGVVVWCFIPFLSREEFMYRYQSRTHFTKEFLLAI